MFRKIKFIVDIDGTLCPVKRTNERYEDLIPYSEMVDRLNYYKDNGAKIVLFTSRNMKSYQGNIGMINVHTARILLEWLDKWKIPYDEIIYGKPWPGDCGYYVDDRAVRPKELLQYSLDELKDICDRDKL